MASPSSKIDATELETSPVDALVRDGCESQREQGILPSPVDVRQYVQPIVEALDRKPQPKATTTADKPSAMQSEFERRGGKDWDSMGIDRERSALVKPQAMRSHAAGIIAERIRLLRSKPDWAARMKTVNPLALNGMLGEDKKREACSKMWQIIHDSCRVFGALADKPKPIWFTP